MRHKLHSILFFNIILFSTVLCQEDYNHPELEWQTLETKHFLVHYHNGAERTGFEVAKIAESIYEPVTSMYGHQPDQKISLIIKDYDDYANGGAYFYDNRIEILAPALDYELRGIHPWLWDVVTHEFTHIIQIQTTMKFGRKFPGIYLQWLGYESERRPDILYGYPNVIVSYPFSGIVIPIWFAEGTAQYSNPSLGYDYWDSHRDMILRMYMLEGNPLSWEEMAIFGKKTLGNESSYNAGFSIVAYIGEKYGSEKLREISQKLSSPLRLTIDGAIEKVLGKTGKQLYEEWRADKTEEYIRLKESISTPIEGKIIENEGSGNYYPVFTPDGSKIAYITEKGQDYFRYSNIYLYDCSTKTSKLIIPDVKLSFVRSALSFSPDGKYIYFAKMTSDNPHGSVFSDLYRYNFVTGKEERLTHALRAFNPKLSADGKKLAYAFGSDGTLNLGICDADGKNAKQLTKYKNGEQTYTPAWSEDGKRIAFGYSVGHNQSIVLIDSNGENFQILPHAGDCRNPFFASDSVLYYSWDKGGIYNIYSFNFHTGAEQQITNVIGGAFLPTLNKQGDLAYASYTSSGYKISLLQRDSIQQWSRSTDSLVMMRNGLSDHRESVEEFNKQYQFLSTCIINDSILSDNVSYQRRDYRSVFTSVSLIPFIRIDNYNESSKGINIIKPGLYISSTEVLNKMDLFGGAAINKIFERDLFAILNYRGRIPILYQSGLEPTATLELYNITRKRDVSFDLAVNNPSNPYGLQTFNSSVTYDLFELDLSLNGKILTDHCNLKIGYTLSRYSQNFGSWGIHPTFGIIPASRSTYFISNVLTLQTKYSVIMPKLDRDINPIGRSLSFKYFYDMDQFNPTDAAELKNGFRVPVYTKFNFSRIECNWTEHMALPFYRQTLSLSLNAAGILGNTIDEFFNYYIGGFIGMRGYPFYAIGGNKTMALNATYRFPVTTEINFRFLQLYFKKLFASVFYDLGNGWSGIMPSINQWKRDVGFEFRIEAFSYYAYPTSIFFSGAYGLDKFGRQVNDINIRSVNYGHEWRFYLGVLFGFELNDIIPNQFMR